VQLSKTVYTCESILLGRPVLMSNLYPGILRLGLRGEDPPDDAAWVSVTCEQLDAIAEAEAVIVEAANRGER
jgi:hypothetical protein